MKKTILALALFAGLTLLAGNAKAGTVDAIFPLGSSSGDYINPVSADTFGTGVNQFTIDFTNIGNAGNATDTTSGWGAGGVSYNYRIGTYSTSQNQIDAATASGLLNVTAGAWSGVQPAANISWYGAAAFVNWLNTSTGHQAAYNLTYNGGSWSMSLWNSFDPGYNSYNQYRNANAYYFLPSMDEWYKAAYGKSDGSGYYLYPTGSDTAPTAVARGTSAGTAVYDQSWVQGPASVYEAGGLSSYGTMGQGGNVGQWIEHQWQGNNTRPSDPRGYPSGSSWSGSVDYQKSSFHNYTGEADSPTYSYIGFRVASVPEPSTYALFGIGAIGLLMVLRRKGTA